MQMHVTWKRTLRTSSSERFLALMPNHEGVVCEVAAVELHYLRGGTAAGTAILLEGGGLTESDVPDLLRTLDEDFLPDVDLSSGSLTYTVVIGRVLANYEASPDPPSA